MTVSLAEFCAALTDLGLVSGDEFRRIMAGLSAEHVAKAELLAKALIGRKTITKYQSQAILAGQAKRLELGSYLLVDQIGQGGMGVVLKAQHRRLKRMVALKVLSPQVTKNAAALKRFQREVQVSAKLEHPNIVVAFDADVARGVHFLVMQYVEGRDLASTIQEKGPLSVEQAIQYLSQAACGLEYAHKQGIIHRDIKPANLLLEKGTGIVKVLDLGLARLDDPDGGQNVGDTGLSITGTIMGTVDYMSPEQAANTKKADHRSDIYSLGITLFYVLTGRLPYEGETLMEKLLAHRESAIPSLSEFRTDIPEGVELLFHRMVAKNPNDRYQSMTEVLAAFLGCLAGAPTTVPSQSSIAGGGGPVESMASDFRGFVEGLNRDPDTDVGFVPGEPTAVTAANHAAPAPTKRLSSIVKNTNRRGFDWKNWKVIAAGVTTLLLIGIGALWMSPKKGAVPVTKKTKEPASSEASAESTDTTDTSSTTESTVDLPPPGTTGEAIKVGAKPALAKLPPLPLGDPSSSLPGLIAEPGNLKGVTRWQVDTVAPRWSISTSDWAPDNQQVVVGCQSGELRIYDTSNWRLRNLMVAHEGGVRSVAWNPEGSRIASSGSDNVIRLWQADGTPGPVLRECPNPGMVAWSPDGEFLIAASGDRSRPLVQMWTADGKPRKIFSGHTGPVRALAWSPDGRHFISASEDGTLRVWDLIGKMVREISGHTKGLHLVTWSATGAIAAADTDGNVYVYPDTSQPPLVSRKISPRALEWNPDGTRLAVALGSQIQLWEADGQLVLQQAAVESQNMAWSPNGKRLVGCGKAVTVWEPGTEAQSMPTLAMMTCLDVHPDGSQFVFGYANGALDWWRQDGTVVRSESAGNYPLSSVAWSPNGKMIATGGRHHLKLWTAEGEPGITFDARGDIQHVKWSPDSLTFATANSDKVRLWGLDGKASHVLQGHLRQIQACDWSTTGDIVTTGRDNTIRLWKSDGTAGPVIDVAARKADLESVAWSPDGKQFAIQVQTKSETRIRIWNADGTEGPELKAPKQVLSFAWSPDGARLLGGDSGGNFRIWAQDGQQGPTYPGPGPGQSVKLLAWSKLDHMMSTGEDRVIRCWDGTSFKLLWFAVSLANGESATLSADGKLQSSTGTPEQVVVYLVERDNGRIEVLSPDDFQKLADR